MEKKDNVVIKTVKEDLGRNYQKALMWYRCIHPHIKRMKEEHYVDMRREWLLVSAVSDMTVEEDGISTVTVEEGLLDKTWRIFTHIFNGPKDVRISDDIKRKYITDCIEQFKRDTSTEELHKDSIALLKLSLEDITMDSQGNNVFDSSNASVFVGSNVKLNHNTQMRWVSSAEDGISRLLEKYGLSQIIIFMGAQGKTEEDNASLLEAKYNIFLNGVTDNATGKHYMSSAPSASGTRLADFPFIEASSKYDVYKIWCEITGFSTIEDLLSNIGSFKDGKYVVNLAKLKARIAMRGSNSFDTYQMVEDEEILYYLKHPNVDYVRDAVGYTDVPYKTITAPGVLEMQLSNDNTVVERIV